MDGASILRNIGWGDNELYRHPGLNGLNMTDNSDASLSVLQSLQTGHNGVEEVIIQTAEPFIQKEEFQGGSTVQLDA